MKKEDVYRKALEDVASMQPIWHGGVGPVPRESLEGLIEQMREISKDALKIRNKK